MEHLIEANLHTYGPLAVFVLLSLSGFGIALGEEMVTIPAGVLIATGRLEFWPVAAAAYSSIVLADLLWFGLCRHYGTPLLHRRWFKRMVHPRRLLEAKHQLEKRGTRFIVMCRFIPSSRTTAITVAGIFHMTYWKFAAATAGCVLLTVPMQLGIGYLVGMGMDKEHDLASLFLRIIGIVLLVVLATLVFGWLSRHKLGRRRPPRARAAWLRQFRRRRSVDSAPRRARGQSVL